MSAPVAAPEPCLVEGYVVGEENGKIVFWKAGSSLWKQSYMLRLEASSVKYFYMAFKVSYDS